MKNIILFFFLVFTAYLNAQSPQGINYQAVIRDAAGNPLVNQNVGIKLDIIPMTGTTPVYSETHTKTTNQFGLINFVIGQGTLLTGTFNTIDWANGMYKTELFVDKSGGASYESMGSQQLMSVPYALYALKSGSGGSTGGIDTPYTAGSGITIANHVVSNTGDLSNTNEIQTLSTSGNNITLSSGGGTITMPTEVYKINSSNVASYTTGSDRIIMVEGSVSLSANFNGFCGANNYVYGGTISGNGQVVCFNNYQTITGTTFTNLDLGSGVGVMFINCTFNNVSKMPSNCLLIGCTINDCSFGSASQIYQISDSRINGSTILRVHKIINSYIYSSSNIGSAIYQSQQISNCSINDSYVFYAGSFTSNILDNSVVYIKPNWTTITCTGNAFEGNSISSFIDIDASTSFVTSIVISGNSFRGSSTNPSSSHIKLSGTYTGTRFMCKISGNNFVGGTGVCVSNSMSGTADLTVSDNDLLYTGGLGVSTGGFVYVRNNQAH